jgi:LPS-assembly protein
MLVFSMLARAQEATPAYEELSASPSLMDVPPQKDWVYLSGDTLSGHTNAETELQGNAQLRKADTLISADHLRYEQSTDRLRASGNVVIEGQDRVYTGSYLDFDVGRFEGFFTEITYSLGAEKGHGEALRADFADSKHMTAKQGTYTTCRRQPGPQWVPEWVLTAAQLEIDNEREIGIAQGAYLEFQGVPIFPVPPFSFPITEKRKSGFLPPLFGLDTASGVTLSTPYYLNIAPNYDLTVTPNFMTTRGVNTEGQVRYLEPSYAGDFKFSYMPNDRLRDSDRWGIGLVHAGQLPSPVGNIAISANINRVSDNDYWSDFSASPILTSGAPLGGTPRTLPTDISASWGRGDLSSMLKIQKWQGLQVTAPYDRIPQWTLRYAQANVFGLDWSVDTDLTRFEGDSLAMRQPNAQRAFSIAQFSYPFIWPALYITPKVQTHLAAYQFDSVVNNKQSANSVVSTFSVDSSLIFERDAEFFGVKYLQTLEPRAFYVYTPYVDQSFLPNYDTATTDLNLTSVFTENAFVGHDKISDNNLITLGLTTRFLNPDSGAQIASFGVAQRWRFDEQKVTLLPGQPSSSTGLSDILLGSRVNFGNQWVLDASAQYNIQTDAAVRSVIGGRYHPGNFQTINLSYLLQRNASEQVDLSWQWPLDRLWGWADRKTDSDAGRYYGLGRLSYSLRDAKLVDSLLGLEYDAGCWISRVVLTQTVLTPQTSNTKLMLQLEFVGFTRLGIDPFKSLTDGIARYQNLR